MCILGGYNLDTDKENLSDGVILNLLTGAVVKKIKPVSFSKVRCLSESFMKSPGEI